MPKVPPGSHIAIRPIGEQESRNPNPERMYFLQHGNGYICCRCAVRQHKLSIITEDRDYAGPHEFLYPGEVRIVGRLTSSECVCRSRSLLLRCPAARTNLRL